MPDEPTIDPEAPTEDQPAVETTPPEQGQGDPSGETPEQYFGETFNPELLPDDLKPAYQQMRADYTRKTQEIAAHRRFFEDRGITPTDPEAAFQALAQELGYQLEDEDPEDDDEPFTDEPADPLEARLDALEAERNAERQRAQDLQSLTDDLDEITKRMGRKPTEQEIDYFGRYAQRDKNGRLGIIDVYDRTEKLMQDRQQQWARSKQAPTVQPGGTPGVASVDLDDPEQRLAYSAELIKQGLTDQ